MVVVNTVRAEPVGTPQQAASIGHLVVKGPQSLLERAAAVPSVTLSHIEGSAEGPVQVSDSELADMRDAMGDSLMHVTVVGTSKALDELAQSDAPDRMRGVFEQKVGASDRAVVWSGAIPSLRNGQTTYGLAMRYGNAVTLLPAVWGPGMGIVKGLESGGGGGVYYHPVCSNRSVTDILFQYALYVGLALLAVVLALVAVRRQDKAARRSAMKQQAQMERRVRQKQPPPDSSVVAFENSTWGPLLESKAVSLE